MKKLNQLKLNRLSKADLEKREMNQIVGGNCCGCGCNGSSSTNYNYSYNVYYGYTISLGGAKYCSCEGDQYSLSHF